MSREPHQLEHGAELCSQPYLLDSAAAEAYGRAIRGPRRRRPAGGIHDDDGAARKAGFEAPIAAGEQTLAVIVQLLVDRFGMRFVRGGHIEIAFTRPVLFGDTITGYARVEGSSDSHLDLALRVENQRGESVLIGTASVRKEA